MFTVDWDRAKDQPTGRASYKGAVSLNKLKAGCPTTVILRKGTKLPGTGAYLQADNYGIRFKDLYKHLNHLVGYLTADAPPQSMTDNFRDPYTGQTTLEIIGQSGTQDVQNTPAQKEKKGFLAWLKSLFHRINTTEADRCSALILQIRFSLNLSKAGWMN